MKAHSRTLTGIWPLWLMVLLMGLSIPLGASAVVVAMVTDLQGRASITSAGKTVPVNIAAEIEAGAQVQLSPGATLVAMYLVTGAEYTFRGSAQAAFKSDQPEMISGSEPTRRGPATGNSIRIKPVGMGQGAMVMRTLGPSARIRLLSASGTIVLDTQPEFVWQEPQAGLKYQIEIADDAGRLLYEAQVDKPPFKLPAGLQLKEGMAYSWSISARMPDGGKYSNIGEFSIAGPDLRARAAALRPAVGADLSSRVIYATWLDQIGLKDDARDMWRALSAERPEDDRLKQLSER